MHGLHGEREPSLAIVSLHRIWNPVSRHAHHQRFPLLSDDLLLRQDRGDRKGAFDH